MNHCGRSHYVTCSLTRGWTSLMNSLMFLSSVRIAHVACYWKFFLLHCQSGLCKADHADFTQQRQLSHVKCRKLDHRQVWASLSAWFLLLLYCEHVHSHDFVWLLLVACTILLCLNSCSSCYNGCLVTWTAVRLTAAKLKPHIFSVSGFVLSDVANICIFMILYGLCPIENTIFSNSLL
jgi:hypothetical protein